MVLTKGTYRLRYRVGGLFEVVTISEGDIKDAYAKTLALFQGIQPLNGSVRFDKKDMIASIYLKVTGTLDLDRWNREFISNWKNIYPWYQSFFQALNFKFIDQQKLKESKAKQQISEPSFAAKMLGRAGKYLALIVIGSIAAYALFSNLEE